jgi:integrase
VIVPVHWMIKEILVRNNGDLPKLKTSQQDFNKAIKCICKKAGINNSILIERTEGNKIIKKRVKKYELVSSHTARRSFATNLYLAGVSVARIMLMTGHKTESSFFKYIRIDKSENARILADNEFFKNKK